MKYCISLGDTIKYIIPDLKPIKLYYHLWSYYYLQNKDQIEVFNQIMDMNENMLIDSGAFTIRMADTLANKEIIQEYDKYTKKYCDFIQEHDNDKMLGYFEMDIDSVTGYDYVLELRKELEEVSDKIIPVWHKERGIHDFKEMCQNYNYVAISNSQYDIKRPQFKLFVDYAHRHGAKIHGLGLANKTMLMNIPFDSCDAINWLLLTMYGSHNGKKLDREYSKNNRNKVLLLGYLAERKKQIMYRNKWKKYFGY